MSAERGNGAAGMTLIEVILAVLILSAGMTAMLTAAGRCVAVMRAAREFQDVIWTLNQGEALYPLLLTNEVTAMEVPAESLDSGMTFERTLERHGEDDESELYEVRTTIGITDGERPRSETFIRFVYIPDDEKT